MVGNLIEDAKATFTNIAKVLLEILNPDYALSE
ncbi:hypothetical protein NIES22_21930 [Calothrix brevissima NIES-22]|nr:hypothetical protein NIES22_21930 [Calothrix brevissima NIES-22]